MRGYRLSPEARGDIDDIWDYIAVDDPRTATRYVAMLTEKFRMVARQPRVGRNCDNLREGLFRYAVGNFLVFYRVADDEIEIVRVLHGARNIEALFPMDD